jgi:intracellular septation protein A
MQGFDFRQFVDSFDFDQLMVFFSSKAYMDVIHNHVFIVVAAVYLALIAYRKTRSFGTKALVYSVVFLIYGTAAVVIKNSRLTDIGPFLLLLVLSLAAAGYAIFTRLVLNK